MIIKVCGMTDADNIRKVTKAGANWIGFIFYPKSPRYIEMVPTKAGIIPDRAKEDIMQPADKIKRVGVFVDDMPQNIITRTVNYQLDIVQLHGHETPTLIRNLRATMANDIRPDIQFIKAICIKDVDDLKKCEDYEEVADYFLFDTKCEERGGSGQHFDWDILNNYQGNTPFLLSGGICIDDAPKIKQLYLNLPLMAGIDLNSRFETKPGIKDAESIKKFINLLES